MGINWDDDPDHRERMHQANVERVRQQAAHLNALDKLGGVLNDDELRKEHSDAAIKGYADGRITYLANKYNEAIRIMHDASGGNLDAETDKIRTSILRHYENMSSKLSDEGAKREEKRRKKEIIAQYDKLVQEKNRATTVVEFNRLAEQFRFMGSHKDANRLAQECEAAADALRAKQVEKNLAKAKKEAAGNKAISALLWVLFIGFPIFGYFYFMEFAHIFEDPNIGFFGIMMIFVPLATFCVLAALIGRWHSSHGMSAIIGFNVTQIVFVVVAGVLTESFAGIGDILLIVIFGGILGAIVSLIGFFIGFFVGNIFRRK